MQTLFFHSEHVADSRACLASLPAGVEVVYMDLRTERGIEPNADAWAQLTALGGYALPAVVTSGAPIVCAVTPGELAAVLAAPEAALLAREAAKVEAAEAQAAELVRIAGLGMAGMAELVNTSEFGEEPYRSAAQARRDALVAEA
jgi:hypothetical protein